MIRHELSVQAIPVAGIAVANRLRAVDEGYARLLAENIEQTGRLRQPIEVRVARGGGYVLIAGAHRLWAVKHLGWITVSAIVVDVASEDEARLAKIDENLVRHDLNLLDRAVFLMEREKIYLRLHPEAIHGGDRRSGGFRENRMDTMSVRSFARDTAERCGISDRTVRRSLIISTRLKEDVRARIAGTALAKKQSELLALARLTPDQQHATLDLLLAAAAKSVKEAKNVVLGVRTPVRSDAETHLQRLTTAPGR